MNVRIDKWCAVALLSATLLSPVLSPPASAQTNKPYIGLNVGNNNDYGTVAQLADLMMTSRGWGVFGSPQGDNVPHTTVDNNGWPMTDSSVYIFAGLDGEGMNGTYALSFSGKATITMSGATFASQAYNSSTNTTTAAVTLSGMVAGTQYQMILNLANTQRTSTSATNTGVTNVKLMRPGYAAGTLFTTNFLSLVENFGAIRFMDWLATNGNQDTNWSDRNTPNTYSQANSGTNWGWQGRGTAYEYAVALCNQSNCDMWVNIPHKATNAFISNVALLIRYGSDGTNPYTSTQSNPVWAPLNSNLHVYVEFSNEIWNYSGAFTQTPDTVNAGINFDTNGDPYHTSYDGTTASSAGFTIGMRYKAYLAMNMSSIFRSVFGSAAMMSRVRPLFETQKTDIPPTLEDPLHYLDAVWNNRAGNYTSTPEPVSYYFWGGGGSGYVEEVPSTWDTDTTLTIDQLFDDYFPLGWPGWNADVSHESGILAGYGMRRDQYEAGPGLDCANGDSCSVKQTGAFNDSRISGVCSSMVTMFAQDGGDMYMHFNSAGNITHGLLLNGFDSTSYKLQGMQTAAAATRSAVTAGVAVPGSINAGSYEFSSDGYSGPSTSTSPVTLTSGYYNYTMRVGTAGTFTIGLTGSAGSVSVIVDGGSSLGTLALPSSSTVTTPSLGVGLHSVCVAWVSGSPTVSTITVSSGGGGSAPSAPTGLTAASGNTQVSLTWSSSSGATSYNVYRGTTAGGESGTAIATGVTSTSYTNTGLTNGTTYYYKVSAVNSFGTSGMSNEASATPSAGTAATPTFSPAAGTYSSAQSVTISDTTGGSSIYYTTDGSTPTTSSTHYTSAVNVSVSQTLKAIATASGYNQSAVGSAAYTISSGGSNLVIDPGYETGNLDNVWYGGGTYGVTTTSPHSGSYCGYEAGDYSSFFQTISGLTASTAYTVTVWAKLSATSGDTIDVYATNFGGTKVSQNVTTTSWTQFTFNFTTGSSSTSAQIGVEDQGGGSSTCYVDDWSVTSGGGSAPAAPTSLTATPGNGQVSLSWTASTGATSYNVYRGTTSGGESGTAIVTGLTTTSYTNTGLTNGTTYYYTVKALNSFGTSGASSEAYATPFAATNLVQNPGFESGILGNYWYGGGTYGVNSSNPHSGTYNGYENGAYSSLFQTVSGLTASHGYTVTVWAKLSGTTSDTVDVFVTNFGGTKMTQNVTTTSYTQFTFSFTTGSSNTSAEIGVEDQNGSSVDCFVDDWTLE